LVKVQDSLHGRLIANENKSSWKLPLLSLSLSLSENSPKIKIYMDDDLSEAVISHFPLSLSLNVGDLRFLRARSSCEGLSSSNNNNNKGTKVSQKKKEKSARSTTSPFVSTTFSFSLCLLSFFSSTYFRRTLSVSVSLHFLSALCARAHSCMCVRESACEFKKGKNVRERRPLHVLYA